MNMSDLNWEHRTYDTYAAYGQSKRANLFFSHELNKRLSAVGVTATSCEPGGAATGLQPKATGMGKKALADLVGYKSFMSTPAAGALMQTYATVKAQPNEMIVPLWGMAGPPVVSGTSLSHMVSLVPVSYAAKDANMLWEQSEKLTGMRFPVPIAL
jgi:NAD(P)-dependent dehydrogenase (short-subunit alcohol dehydrogenase family)